jgi:hypothetical protein
MVRLLKVKSSISFTLLQLPYLPRSITMNEVTEYEVNAYDYGAVRYQLNQQHRDKNPNKSQWEISNDNEIYVFRCAAYHKWFAESNAWALFLIDNVPHPLGTVAQNRKTFIAKFVTDNNHNAWHGYPADYLTRSHDIPHGSILYSWVSMNLISKPKMRKIMQGQPCNI